MPTTQICLFHIAWIVQTFVAFRRSLFMHSNYVSRSANDIVICGELPFDRMFLKWSGDDLCRSNEFDFMPLQSTEWNEDIREFLLIILLNKTKTFATLKLNFNAAAIMFFTFSWFSSAFLWIGNGLFFRRNLNCITE